MEFAPITEIKRNLAVLDEAGRIASRLGALYASLKEADLEPNDRVNSLFGELVATVAETNEPISRLVLAKADVGAIRDALQNVCALGEGKLESYWASRITSAADPEEELHRFPYFENYRKLTLLEAGALRPFAEAQITNVLFIGSGPLPLSAIFMAREFGWRVDCVERDADAVRISRQLIEALGLSDKVRVIHDDIRQVHAYGEYQALFLAALVGTGNEKKEIIGRIGAGMNARALLLARSAYLLRTFLYPEVAPEAFPGLHMKAIIHPVDDVINSVMVAQKYE